MKGDNQIWVAAARTQLLYMGGLLYQWSYWGAPNTCNLFKKCVLLWFVLTLSEGLVRQIVTGGIWGKEKRWQVELRPEQLWRGHSSCTWDVCSIKRASGGAKLPFFWLFMALLEGYDGQRASGNGKKEIWQTAIKSREHVPSKSHFLCAFHIATKTGRGMFPPGH